MSNKDLSQRDLFRNPQTPTASSVDEVAENWAREQAAENSQQQALMSSPSEGEDEGGFWGLVSDVGDAVGGAIDEATEIASGVVDSVTETVSGVVNGVVEGVESLFDMAQEWYEQEPHIQVLELYAELGHTDAFLQALYDNEGYLSAALDMVFDGAVLNFLASPTLSTALVDEFPEKAGSELVRIFDNCPHGAGLSEEVRAMLTRWVPHMTLEQIRPAFEARFDVNLEEQEASGSDAAASWSVEMLRAIWLQLDVLPLDHVSGNTCLEAFEAIRGSGGFWSGGDTVQIGEDKDPAHVDHTVRHEIGHAVHSERAGTIDAWLQAEMNMWHFSGDASGLGQWVTDLGGFPDTWTNAAGEEQSFGATEKAEVLDMLQSFLGGGSSWSPARANITDDQDADRVAYWSAMPANVQDAVTQSTSRWYNNYTNWASGTKGKYFLNYWYAVPYYMGATAESVVGATGRNYTAMSYKEFFANCYAEFFEDPAGYADHSLWGGSLPGSVQTFMRNHVLDRQPYTPPSEGAANVEGEGDSPAMGQTPPRPTGEAGTP